MWQNFLLFCALQASLSTCFRDRVQQNSNVTIDMKGRGSAQVVTSNMTVDLSSGQTHQIDIVVVDNASDVDERSLLTSSSKEKHSPPRRGSIDNENADLSASQSPDIYGTIPQELSDEKIYATIEDGWYDLQVKAKIAEDTYHAFKVKVSINHGGRDKVREEEAQLIARITIHHLLQNQGTKELCKYMVGSLLKGGVQVNGQQVGWACFRGNGIGDRIVQSAEICAFQLIYVRPEGWLETDESNGIHEQLVLLATKVPQPREPPREKRRQRRNRRASPNLRRKQSPEKTYEHVRPVKPGA